MVPAGFLTTAERLNVVSEDQASEWYGALARRWDADLHAMPLSKGLRAGR